MNKTKISIERQINDRQYQFLVPFEAPLSEVFLIIEDIKKYVAERIMEAENQASQQDQQSA